LASGDLAAGRLLAPFGFVETDARWVLCSRRQHSDPRLPALAAWLRTALEEH
jgi:hypothetical protein